MKKYILLHGTHIGPGKTPYKKGDTIKSTTDLVALFPNKFQLVAEIIVEKEKPKKKKKTDSKPPEDNDDEGNDDEDDADTDTDDDAPEVVDVTEKFQSAVDNKLAVFKQGKLYTVKDLEDEEAGVLNDTELKSKTKVNAFIESYLED